MKSLYFSLPLLLSLWLLNGCGSDFTEPSNSEAFNGASIANGTEACVQEYYKTEATPKLSACAGCHRQGGAADPQGITLKFPQPAELKNIDNYLALKNYIRANGTTIIKKIDGTLSHGGGSSFSDVKPILQTLVNYIEDVSSCRVTQNITVKPITLASIELLDYKNIASNAAYLLLSRAPTTSELASVTDKNSLYSLLDTYMNDEAFYDFIRLKFNDFLLVKKYERPTRAIALLNNTLFPNRNWADGNATLQALANDGVYKAPLELVVHVLKLNRPFSEILTANYKMVNPYSARSFGVNIAGFTYQDGDAISARDPLEFREAQITYPSNGVAIPHAGLLTDVVFLNRFPNSNTNRNRHRSFKTLLFFMGIDILSLADRPVSAREQALAYEYPTTQNPNCTVCHFTMDPVAGAFKNFDNRGIFQAGRSWSLNHSGPIGFTLEDLMPNDKQNSGALQWLAQEITADPRFVQQSVAIFYKALTGREPLKEPKLGVKDYALKKQAFLFQNTLMRQIAFKFKSSNLNAKSLIKELLVSPLLSAKKLSMASTNPYFSQSVGLSLLISPEALDKKIKNIIGYYWTDRFDSSSGNASGRHYLLDSNNYLSLYGGIDSDEVIKRPKSVNGVMAGVQMRMALEMGCFSAARDFFFPQSSRKLFTLVETSDEPTNINSVMKIRQNIQKLHALILGEDLALDSKEVLHTFALFNRVYQEGKAAIQSGQESSNLSSLCDVTTHPDTGASLNTESTPRNDGERVTRDPNYVIRSWAAVLSYLLSDFKFVYNTSAQ